MASQTINIPASAISRIGSTLTRLQLRGGSAVAIDRSLRSSDAARYFGRIQFGTTLNLRVGATASGSTSGSQQDLSDAFETNGWIVLTQETRKIAVSIGGLDTSEPYSYQLTGTTLSDVQAFFRNLDVNKSATLELWDERPSGLVFEIAPSFGASGTAGFKNTLETDKIKIEPVFKASGVGGFKAVLGGFFPSFKGAVGQNNFNPQFQLKASGGEAETLSETFTWEAENISLPQQRNDFTNLSLNKKTSGNAQTTSNIFNNPVYQSSFSVFTQSSGSAPPRRGNIQIRFTSADGSGAVKGTLIPSFYTSGQITITQGTSSFTFDIAEALEGGWTYSPSDGRTADIFRFSSSNSIATSLKTFALGLSSADTSVQFSVQSSGGAKTTNYIFPSFTASGDAKTDAGLAPYEPPSINPVFNGTGAASFGPTSVSQTFNIIAVSSDNPSVNYRPNTFFASLGGDDKGTEINPRFYDNAENPERQRFFQNITLTYAANSRGSADATRIILNSGVSRLNSSFETNGTITFISGSNEITVPLSDLYVTNRLYYGFGSGATYGDALNLSVRDFLLAINYVEFTVLGENDYVRVIFRSPDTIPSLEFISDKIRVRPVFNAVGESDFNTSLKKTQLFNPLFLSSAEATFSSILVSPLKYISTDFPSIGTSRFPPPQIKYGTRTQTITPIQMSFGQSTATASTGMSLIFGFGANNTFTFTAEEFKNAIYNQRVRLTRIRGGGFSYGRQSFLRILTTTENQRTFTTALTKGDTPRKLGSIEIETKNWPNDNGIEKPGIKSVNIRLNGGSAFVEDFLELGQITFIQGEDSFTFNFNDFALENPSRNSSDWIDSSGIYSSSIPGSPRDIPPYFGQLNSFIERVSVNDPITVQFSYFISGNNLNPAFPSSGTATFAARFTVQSIRPKYPPASGTATFNSLIDLKGREQFLPTFHSSATATFSPQIRQSKKPIKPIFAASGTAIFRSDLESAGLFILKPNFSRGFGIATFEVLIRGEIIEIVADKTDTPTDTGFIFPSASGSATWSQSIPPNTVFTIDTTMVGWAVDIDGIGLGRRPFRLWSGEGQLTLEGTTYEGTTFDGGALATIGPVEQVSGDPSSRANVSISVPNAAIRAMLNIDIGPVWVEVFNIYSIDGGATWTKLQTGIAGRLSRPNFDVEGSIYTVEIETWSGDADRGVPRIWSDESQQAEYRNDKGMEFLREYEAGVEIKWPP